jgi:energy-converting hydrogenase B subunit D
MIEAILALLLMLGLVALRLSNLVNAVICLAVFSLLSALLFYLLHAPDVAIAEAAVGAGLSTVVFLWAIGRTQGGRS